MSQLAWRLDTLALETVGFWALVMVSRSSKVVRSMYVCIDTSMHASMYVCTHAQLGPALCNPMDCSLTGSSVRGIFQARILEWIAMPSSRESS